MCGREGGRGEREWVGGREGGREREEERGDRGVWEGGRERRKGSGWEQGCRQIFPLVLPLPSSLSLSPSRIPLSLLSPSCTPPLPTYFQPSPPFLALHSHIPQGTGAASFGTSRSHLYQVPVLEVKSEHDISCSACAIHRTDQTKRRLENWDQN